MSRCWWLASVLLFALACSGSSVLKPDQLESEMRQLRSLGAEETLLRNVAATHHVTRRFARLHAQFMVQTAHEHVAKLAKATAQPGSEGELARARDAATKLEERFIALTLELR